MKIDGIKISRKILADLKRKISGFRKKPILAVIWLGDNFICGKFIKAKAETAKSIGVGFKLFKFCARVGEKEVQDLIEKLNADSNIDGIMIQLPVPEGLDRKKLISKISPVKDVDGLRFCAGLDSKFLPAVALAILEALDLAKVNLKRAKIAVIGKGFLVGNSIGKLFSSRAVKFAVIDSKTKNADKIISEADVVITATGKSNLIKCSFLKEGVVLIDAGSAEEAGKITGDSEPACYAKASFYTPVPGGIGPITVAMLMKNLVEKS
ncbi:hypothetical protein COT77_02110 [Candidatus Berkelbacteria bacterium CG10_big_fil_rev_8_21_14_0_10_41_12]|uniref:Uncharacterized protein n=1 Tax=Candidatus Berkelbacteria bacterium CG10_big_fil_rev_8_21_14_0_10_41_12 TaxID=1974513 RepID=A0A2M6WX07_9BACT|nr:MAG: hypothetical protein COT77_02110 [Candidatus Berkelbacteria bacterium CG10_big_fil_rev_8_21_14_0_10_41_12]